MEIILARPKHIGKSTCNNIKVLLHGNATVTTECFTRSGQNIVLFNWGRTSLQVPENTVIINRPERVKVVSNKIETRKILIEHGINVPITLFSKDEAMAFIEKNPYTKLIGRPGKHYGGKNVIFIKSRYDLIKDCNSEYWSEYIEKDEEYGIFVFKNRVIGGVQKIVNNKNKIVWNHCAGGYFKTIYKGQYPQEVRDISRASAKVLEIDFSRVDIITKDRKTYVLELNTAPQLSGFRQQMLVKEINKILENNKWKEKPA